MEGKHEDTHLKMCTRWTRHRGNLWASKTSWRLETGRVPEDGLVGGTKSVRGRNRSFWGCSVTLLREWVAILSLNGARLIPPHSSLHFPRKTNCLTDASIPELKHKMGRVIFKLWRQLWQLEQQLKDDASNLRSMPFQLLGACSLWRCMPLEEGYCEKRGSGGSGGVTDLTSVGLNDNNNTSQGKHLLKCLPYAKQYAKHFVWIISFNSHNTPITEVDTIPVDFYQQGNKG